MVEAQNPRRCPACMMLQRLCICSDVPRLETLSRLVLVVHHRELKKPTNTGGLAARCLVNSEVHVSGAIGTVVDYDAVAPESATNLFLFPSEDAVPLTPENARGFKGPIRLIVPDGNWGQAARIRKKLKDSPRIINVSLPEGPVTRYQLRREALDRPEGLATLEAIARAMHALEGPQISDALLAIFRTFVDRTLWSRGKLAAASVQGGIPPVSDTRSAPDHKSPN